ncbi:MAG: AMP-binding protein [Phycisphaerales bacterium]|nr:AMP-binding protein [Phycisphaerales bacterium]
MSLHWPILKALLKHPTRPCIVDDARSYRGIDIAVASSHVAAAIAGVCATRTVALLLPTSGAFPIGGLAGWMAGKTIVPLNYLLKPEELKYVLADCGADTVIAVQPMLDFLGYRPEVKNLLRLEDINFRSMPDVRWPARPSDDDLALLLYTSGTSGRPKGVMLTHGNIRANVEQIRDWIPFTPNESFLGVLPQFHSFGLTALTLLPLAAGCPVVYTARFVPQKIVRLMREHRPTVFIAIPSMYNAMLHVKDAGREDFASLRYVVSGGEPLPEAVFQGFRDRFGVTINEGYGLTETSPVSNWCRPQDYRHRSVGMPLPRVRERIVDINTGADLPPGHEGEIRIAGPHIMRGYYHLPAETISAFDEQGFFRTGDIGRMDEDRHLYITGRLKEMLIVAGENVFPREIEEVLDKHPVVKASGVVGMVDALRGELPLAFVELREGAVFDEKDILAWCRKHLAGYKVPREVRVLAELPRNPTGKVLRRELKKLV